jgi:hypothetical protein
LVKYDATIPNSHTFDKGFLAALVRPVEPEQGIDNPVSTGPDGGSLCV